MFSCYIRLELEVHTDVSTSNIVVSTIVRKCITVATLKQSVTTGHASKCGVSVGRYDL